MSETPLIVYKDIDVVDIDRLEVYESRGGYEALKKVISSMDPEEVIDLVKRSRLHGRGGAAFPTGLKWEFVYQDVNGPKYVVCNAEEGEPGTFKDRLILECVPHRLVEAMTIAGYAVKAKEGYIVCRGEYEIPALQVGKAIAEAREKGYLGKKILGSDFSFDIKVYRTAGAYICGEETALLEALEGKAGLARIRPPFPVNAGLWQLPTALNNVETFASVPDIILKGPEWYAAIGSEKTPGTKVYCLSGHVKKPGTYELPLGISLRELIYDYGEGIIDNRDLKAVFPGGASSSCLLPEDLDVSLDYASVAEAGSMLGSAAVIVIANGTCMVAVALCLARFFRHESCGKCIPCREGTRHVVRILESIIEGRAKKVDMKNLEDLCQVVRQTAFCGLGQAAVNPVLCTMKHFRQEFLEHISKGKCPASG